MCQDRKVEDLTSTATIDPVQLNKPIEAKDDFYWVGTDEPHATRRKSILAKYPEIKKLFGHCPKTKYVAALVFFLQTFISSQARYMSWPIFLVTSYIIGGTCHHVLVLAMHELSHNLGFKKMSHNRLYSLFISGPLIFPAAVAFKGYHLEHHRYQGEDGVDGDLPTQWEGRVFNTTFKKLIFVILQMAVYALRPCIVMPKALTRWHMYNILSSVVYTSIVYTLGGYLGIFYLIVSLFWSGGLHPLAAHFISEHYVFTEGQETYSYYGILNKVSFNVGYHNEHHDFPFIPGSRLPKVREIASEFYDTLPYHTSWVRVMYEFITNPAIGAFSRVKRSQVDKSQKSKLHWD
uniref:sphingolipid 4-desaturase n=1 Tax=Albugo laibachii Nc14 TaxID=890382 RepID=F0WJN9_9STRA|nr:sphingolipid delta(4)desaturase DES1like protein put [Albugo laibachii Nc14]|eukprot:CCA21489.1 sphingolipid delta(4)desaturase DES1like protein put [Albugo laibachii Nc14]